MKARRCAATEPETPRPQLTAARDEFVYYPDTTPVSEWAVGQHPRTLVRGRGAGRHPGARSRGGAFAQGTRFGGHGLYVKDNRLHYVNNFVGAEEQMIVGSEDVPTGENLILAASSEKETQEPASTTGTLTLYHGDRNVGEGKIKSQMGFFAIAGAGVYVGRHGGEPLTDDYPGQAPYTFTGGTLHQVSVNVSGEPYSDLERRRRCCSATNDEGGNLMAEARGLGGS